MGFTSTLVALVAALCLTATHASEIRVPGRCPEVCRSDLAASYNECRNRYNRGCTLSFCGTSASRQTRCTLRTTGPDFIRLYESVTLYRPKVSSTHSINVDFKGSPVKTDIYFLIDATGSMGSLILSIQEQFPRLVAGVKAISDAAFGMGIFRDERELNNGFENIQSVSTNSRLSRTALANVSAGGGQDAEEANLVALYKLATDPAIGWRDASRRIVLYIADEPGHEPTCLGEGFRLDRANVIASLNKASVSVIAISYPVDAMDRATKQLGCGPKVFDAPAGQGTAIAEGTGGIYLSGNDNVFNVKEILSSIRKLTKKVTVSNNSCTKYLNMNYLPALPAVLPSNARLRVTFTVRPTSCELKSTFECKIWFLESGVVLKPFVVRLQQVQDCTSV